MTNTLNVPLQNSYNEVELNQQILKEFCKCSELPKFNNSLEFFENGFELTDDDRFKTFDIHYSPWIRELCKWFDDIETDWIYLIMGSQISKTTFMMGILLYVSQFLLGQGNIPCLWVQSVQEEAETFIDGRLWEFLDDGKHNTRKDWKKQAFKVNNAKVKVGYATNKTTLRSKAQQFVFGDECALWRVPIEYVKKRLRTFKGKLRKGIFSTTPPDDKEHHSAMAMRVGNFYQWWVPCHSCNEFQPMLFNQLKWYVKAEDEEWDHSKVKDSAHYECRFCNAHWQEKDKLELINKGKFVCVDSETYKPKKEKNTDSKTAHISALYSIFTAYGDLACDFLTAKASGVESLKIFLTDELAEIPDNEIHFSIDAAQIAKFQDASRKLGQIGEGYALYTAAVDLQQTGKAFIVVTGFRVNKRISAHVIDHIQVKWRDSQGKYYWSEIEKALEPYEEHCRQIVYDATDGIVATEVQDYCMEAGPKHIPLLDVGMQKEKLEVKMAQDLPKNKRSKYLRHKYHGLKIYTINSDMFKDDFAYAMKKSEFDPDAWSFPRDATKLFFTHMSNEQRKKVKVGNKYKSTWSPRYSNAPQHFFSAFIYSLVPAEEIKYKLIKKIRNKFHKKVNSAVKAGKKRRVRTKGKVLN